mmetsp:Transcript_30559/g.70476  ORF Transcript_30559/g.70476 Transcript_30559/m.70476 type:complete len:338 (+) Transcript_30559:202-1215(+)
MLAACVGERSSRPCMNRACCNSPSDGPWGTPAKLKCVGVEGPNKLAGFLFAIRGKGGERARRQALSSVSSTGLVSTTSMPAAAHRSAKSLLFFSEVNATTGGCGENSVVMTWLAWNPSMFGSCNSIRTTSKCARPCSRILSSACSAFVATSVTHPRLSSRRCSTLRVMALFSTSSTLLPQWGELVGLQFDGGITRSLSAVRSSSLSLCWQQLLSTSDERRANTEVVGCDGPNSVSAPAARPGGFLREGESAGLTGALCRTLGAATSSVRSEARSAGRKGLLMYVAMPAAAQRVRTPSVVSAESAAMGGCAWNSDDMILPASNPSITGMCRSIRMQSK